jgi:hypothetical protein
MNNNISTRPYGSSDEKWSNNTTDIIDAPNCPNEWIYFKDKCYFIEKTKLSHDEAEMSCRSKNATLAIIRNDNEFYFIQLISKPYFHVHVSIYS